MGQIRIQYLLSEQGRKASILAGGDGRHVQRLTVEVLPEALALAHVAADGTATVYVGHDGMALEVVQRTITGYDPVEYGDAAGHLRTVRGVVEWDSPQAPTDLLASEAARRAGVQTERATRLAESEAAASTRAAEAEAERRDVAAMRAEEERRQAAHAAENECRRAAAAQAALAYTAEREAWVVVHGSERLRAALVLGLLAECDAVYCDERLAVERPGWEWEPESVEVQALRNPSVEQLSELAAARRRYPAQAGSANEVELKFLDLHAQSEPYKGRALRTWFLDYRIYRWV